MKTAAFVSVIILALSLSFYVLVYIPKKDSEQKEAQNKKSEVVAICTQQVLNIVKDINEYTMEDFNNLVKVCLMKNGYEN